QENRFKTTRRLRLGLRLRLRLRLRLGLRLRLRLGLRLRLRLRLRKRPKLALGLEKNWRQPTLAESIKPLPSARLRLTAEFGMGSGRTTALWPPKRKGRMQNAEWRIPTSRRLPKC